MARIKATGMKRKRLLCIAAMCRHCQIVPFLKTTIDGFSGHDNTTFLLHNIVLTTGGTSLDNLRLRKPYVEYGAKSDHKNLSAANLVLKRLCIIATALARRLRILEP